MGLVFYVGEVKGGDEVGTCVCREDDFLQIPSRLFLVRFLLSLYEKNMAGRKKNKGMRLAERN